MRLHDPLVCALFMGAWKKPRSICRKISMPILGGGNLGFGGGKCRFYFCGREDFSENRNPRASNPCLFLGGKNARKPHPKNKGSSLRRNALNPWKRKEKRTKKTEGPKGGRRKGGRGRKLSHFSFCCAFRCCVVYSPCFPVWGEEKVMTIYHAGPLAAGPLCGLLKKH